MFSHILIPLPLPLNVSRSILHIHLLLSLSLELFLSLLLLSVTLALFFGLGLDQAFNALGLPDALLLLLVDLVTLMLYLFSAFFSSPVLHIS
jgi:hypothetical protein